MNENVKSKIELFAENRKRIHEAFKWDWDMMSVVAGLVFTGADKTADIDRMKECEKILEKKKSAFSVFRGNDKLILISKMAIADDAENYLDKVIAVYDKISAGKIFADSFLLLGAVVIVDQNKDDDADSIITKYKEIIKRMSKIHPIITDSIDIPMAVMLAMSDKDIDYIISETEEGYEYMKKNFKSYSNPTQSLSHVLALTDGNMIDKCNKVMQIYYMLKERGAKYGREYEFASLGSLIDIDMDMGELADEIVEADNLLASYKGFGAWSMDRSTRLMFAAVITAEVFEPDTHTLNCSVLGSSLAIVIAEEIMIMMVVMMCTNNNAST